MTWSFAVWGLDIVGPFKKAPGGFTHLFVAIDKFTKWIEVKSVNKITSKKAVEFVREVFTPHDIITNNGTQFTSEEFRDFADEMGIKIHFASVAHPQSNGQIEQATV